MPLVAARGVLIANYETAAETYKKRVTLFVQIGGMCSGFARKNDQLKTKFVEKLILLAHHLNIDVTLPPSDKKAKPIPRIDPTIARATAEQLSKITFVGQVIFNRLCRQLEFIYIDGPFNFGVKNGLILTARVVWQTENQGNVRTE